MSNRSISWRIVGNIWFCFLILGHPVYLHYLAQLPFQRIANKPDNRVKLTRIGIVFRYHQSKDNVKSQQDPTRTNNNNHCRLIFNISKFRKIRRTNVGINEFIEHIPVNELIIEYEIWLLLQFRHRNEFITSGILLGLQFCSKPIRRLEYKWAAGFYSIFVRYCR